MLVPPAVPSAVPRLGSPMPSRVIDLCHTSTRPMNDAPDSNETRVAVLVDCDNTSPQILEHALCGVAQFGRVVLRRGYGNHQTLANKWQEVLVRLAFTPCLQYQYAAGKKTADIALALDAMEAMFDGRADTFCLVTSDSDFAYPRCVPVRAHVPIVWTSVASITKCRC